MPARQCMSVEAAGPVWLERRSLQSHPSQARPKPTKTASRPKSKAEGASSRSLDPGAGEESGPAAASGIGALADIQSREAAASGGRSVDPAAPADVLMEGVVEKLKLLGYEEAFCRASQPVKASWPTLMLARSDSIICAWPREMIRALRAISPLARRPQKPLHRLSFVMPHASPQDQTQAYYYMVDLVLWLLRICGLGASPEPVSVCVFPLPALPRAPSDLPRRTPRS